MNIKRMVAVSAITFFIGCAGGGVFAYVNHPANGGHGSASLSETLRQAHEDREFEQFINQQEKLRPDGMEQSKIEAGSKYTGITYNGDSQNVVIATQPKEQGDVPLDKTQSAAPSSGFLDTLMHSTKDNSAPSQDVSQKIITGRVAIQNGSLNIRDQAGTDGNIIGQVYKNDTVQIIGQQDGWYQITAANGIQGFVSATYIEVTE